MRVATTAVLTITALTCTAGPALATTEVSAADRAAITKAINTAERNADPATRCGALSASLIKSLYGTKSRCVIEEQEDAPSDLPKSVSISTLSVSGNKATVRITEHGGAGASGTWQLTRSGSTWQVSAMEADYFRSALRNVFGPKYKSAGATIDPLDNKAYRACGVAGLLNRSDKAFLALMKEIETSHYAVFGKVFSACTAKAPGRKSPFRTVFEYALREGAKGAPAGLADCVVTKLRSTISEATLINEYMDSAGSAGNNKLIQAIHTAAGACNKSGGSGRLRPKGIVRPHPIH
jgi:hypothetical protein